MSLLNQSNHYSTEKASCKSIFGFDIEMVFPILVVIEIHNLKKSPKRVDGINPFFFSKMQNEMFKLASKTLEQNLECAQN